MPESRKDRQSMTLQTCTSITLLALGLLTAESVGQGAAHGAASRGAIDRIEVGFNGTSKVGYWTPVWVTLTAGEQPLKGCLQLTTVDGDGISVGYRDDATGEVDLLAGESGRFLRYLKFGRIQTGITVQLFDGQTEAIRRQLGLGQFPAPQIVDRPLLITVGTSVAAEAAFHRSSTPNEGPLSADITDAQDLPDRWLGYESVDQLILTTYDNTAINQMSAAQFQAIEDWVQLGGRLTITVGSRGGEIASSGDGDWGMGWLTRFLPGSFDNVGSLRSAAALEAFAGSSQALKVGSRGLPVTLLNDVRGTIELSDTGVRGLQPLIVSSAYGLGQVTFVAVDLDQPPFDAWEGRGRLLARLLRDDKGGTSAARSQRKRGRVTHVGYTDMTGQLRSALDQFAVVSLVPFYWVAGLAFAYVLLIGPGDYFFLKRIVRRMPWTWVSFPLIVVGFSTVAVLLNQRLKVDEIRINQVDLVDFDVPRQLLRGTTWADIYSPVTETYDLNWNAAPHVDRVLKDNRMQSVFSWQGLPGTGLGGLNTQAAQPTFIKPYLISIGADQTSFLETPIQVDSTKSFHGRWWGVTRPLDAGDLSEDGDGLLRGTVINPLDIPLDNCMVLFSNWMYRLDSKSGSLGAGASTTIELEQPLNLEWRLTKRRVEETRDASTPWNQEDLDVSRIMEIMMFHAAAGGDRYTQLTHRYQSFMDLSHQLKRGRAILLGRADKAATELRIDDRPVNDNYDNNWTFCRVVVPVTPWQSSLDPLERDRLDRARIKHGD
jgi:hypothetical protein